MPKIRIKPEDFQWDFKDIEELEKSDEIEVNREYQGTKRELVLGEVSIIKVREKCPSCGGELVYAPVSDNQQGTGQTYSQRMKPYSIYEEIVCSRCGLVVKEETRRVYR